MSRPSPKLRWAIHFALQPKYDVPFEYGPEVLVLMREWTA